MVQAQDGPYPPHASTYTPVWYCDEVENIRAGVNNNFRKYQAVIRTGKLNTPCISRVTDWTTLMTFVTLFSVLRYSSALSRRTSLRRKVCLKDLGIMIFGSEGKNLVCIKSRAGCWYTYGGTGYGYFWLPMYIVSATRPRSLPVSAETTMYMFTLVFYGVCIYYVFPGDLDTSTR